ncbi:MAG: hypothetical protein JW746_01370 [Candidatus Krumholzibacteriota bacterium]|nr:hypothetical protein [Candidatus Krumholzibacteriota bacterium]
MKRFILLFLAVLLISGNLSAQIEKGDREIQASGFFIAFEGITMMTVSGTYGYYKTEKLEIGGGPVLSRIDFGFGSSTTLSLTAFGRYHLTARDKLVPYLSGQWYQFDVSPEEPASFLDYSFVQGGGGFKYFINEFIAYDVSGNLGFSFGSGSFSFIMVAGISAFF